MRGTLKSQYTDVENRAIYVLMSPISKEFFCSHCPTKSLHGLYRQHFSQNRPKTARWIAEDLKSIGLHPCLFILEELNCTKVEAFSYVIVWTKIFHEAGYESLQQGNVMDYKEDLFDGNQQLYEQRKNLDLKELLCCKNCKVQTYHYQKCMHCTETVDSDWGSSDTKDLYIKIRVTKEQDKQIRQMAKLCNRKVSSYVRDVARNVVIIKTDNERLDRHIDVVDGLCESNLLLANKVLKGDQYVSGDIENILHYTKEVLKVEKEILKEQQEIEMVIRETISKAIRSEINRMKQSKEEG